MKHPASAAGSEELVIECRICGNPLTVQIGTSIDAETTKILHNIAKNVVHEHCANKHEMALREQEAVLQQTKRMENWMRLCPATYQDTDISRLRKKHGTKIDQVLNWQYGPKGLFLWGASRTGKTRSMWLLLRKQFNQSKFIVSMTHSAFATKAISLEPDANSRWQKLLTTVDILFIDDLGKGKLTTRDGGASQAEEVLFSVFDQRISKGLPTCWTSEWDAADLKAKFSQERADSLTARLVEFSLDIQLRK